MPQRHEYLELSDDLTPQQRALAEAVRGLASASELSYGQLAKRSYVSKSLIGDLASGKRKRRIDPENLRPFHTAASAEAAERGARAMAWEEFSACCTALGEPAESEVCGECGAKRDSGPSERSSGRRQSGGPADSAVDGAVSGRQEPRVVLPVPRPRGDRQARADVFWPHMPLLKGYLDAGNLENATSLLRSVGRHVPPEETAEAIAACASAGLEEAAEMLLQQASARDSREVLKVLQELNRAERRTESDALLGLALAGAGT
ncbi:MULTISPECIES: hypothetical protein [Kitasatospora]|uniref:Uncharacterized protein n=1 Tax=Kitasatospora setae (strain ATCC 33774 / DSM 43861 / JCM 3304 / KCC A-0304 / NBRC 14216 / KM-6054) TaxID=452652 RepID=E4N3S6_KITSK|nr:MULTISPECIES: hypothetical protein [Kitasatospora]BAJ31557.1 hypothetical protein KSE_57850 [Kitasatospora setae KM-6054]